MKIFLGYWLANIYDTIWDKTVYGRLLSEQPSQKHIQNVNISFSNHLAFTQCNAFNNDLKIPPLNDNFNQAVEKVYSINQQESLSNDFYPIPNISIQVLMVGCLQCSVGTCSIDQIFTNIQRRGHRYMQCQNVPCRKQGIISKLPRIGPCKHGIQNIFWKTYKE